MRSYFTIILLIFTTSISLNAQFLQDFDAKEGITQATTEAGASLSSPYLKGVGMVNLEKFDLELPFDVAFNPNNGNSKLWIYFFGDADDPNDEKMEFVPIGKVLLMGLTNLKTLGFPSDVMIEDVFPFIPLKANWMGSIDFVSGLNSNSSFQQLKLKYSSSEFLSVGIASNDDEDTGIYGDPYWMIQYAEKADDLDFVCYSNALNGSIECFDLNAVGSVKYELAKDIQLFPQPAIEEINANFENQYKTFKVVDLFGNEVKTGLINQGNKQFNLSISGFSSGVYYLILENDYRNDVVRFVKI